MTWSGWTTIIVLVGILLLPMAVQAILEWAARRRRDATRSTKDSKPYLGPQTDPRGRSQGNRQRSDGRGEPRRAWGPLREAYCRRAAKDGARAEWGNAGICGEALEAVRGKVSRRERNSLRSLELA